jgi:Spy/CpxP family protein refolding chaperone
MKKKIKLVAFSVVLLLMASAAVYAQEKEKSTGRESRGEMHNGERILSELNLTPEQKKKLQENRAAQRQQMEALRTSLKGKREQIEKALKNPSVTRAEVEPIAAEIKTLQDKLTDLRLDGIFAVKEILSPEQYLKFQNMTEKKERNKPHKRPVDNHKTSP